MLEHSDCLAPGRTGKTASRETEQNVNAAVLWSSYQRGLPEQGGLGGRQVTRSRRLRGTGTREERERGAVLRQEGKQSLLFLRTKALVMEDSAGVTLLSTM